MLNKVANVDLRFATRTAKAQPGVGVSYILGIYLLSRTSSLYRIKKVSQRRRGVDPA